MGVWMDGGEGVKGVKLAIQIVGCLHIVQLRDDKNKIVCFSYKK